MLLTTLALALPLSQVTPDDALLADINTVPAQFDFGSLPIAFASDGDVVYFAAREDGVYELYATDGAGQFATKFEQPTVGPIGSLTGQNSTRPVVAFLPDGGGAGVFVASTPATGRELWRADGLSGNAFPLGDLRPGAASSAPESFVELQDQIYFLADDGSHGRELWVTNGSASATQLAADLEPGPGSLWSGGEPNEGMRLASTGSTLVLARATLGQLDLFTSDGGPAPATGLVSIPTIGTERPFKPGRVGTIGDKLLFGVRGELPGSQGVWVTDGTSGGTSLILPDVELTWLVVDGDRAFLATRSGFDGSLWVTDGTAAGTQQLMGPSFDYQNPTVQRGAMFNGELYLAAWALNEPQGNTGTELIATDGTVAGTRLAADVAPGGVSSVPRYLTVWGNRLFFVADVAGVAGLFRTDTTGASFAQVDDPFGLPQGFVDTTFGGNYPVDSLSPFFPAEKALVYPRVTNGSVGGDIEPWRANAVATVILLDISDPATSDSEPRELTQVGDLLFFSASPTSPFIRKLFVYDTSTGEGPNEVVVPTGSVDLEPRNLTPFKGGLAFAGQSNTTFERDSVWWTDGNAVIELAPEPFPANAGHLTAAGDQLFYTGGFFDDPTDLYVSDGTAGSAQVVPPAGVTATVSWSQIVHLGDGRVVGSGASDLEPFDNELLVSDGTPEGTFRIDIYPGPTGSSPQNFAVSDGIAYFQASDGVNGIELWRSDGTPEGTNLVIDATPGNDFSRVWGTAPFGDGVVYTYQSGNDYAVVFTDGTAGGTQILVNGQGSAFGPYIERGDRLFFPWGSPEYSELWVSDGTPGGTNRVPGTGSGALELQQFARPVAFGSDSVAFGADDGLGIEWYSSDGTFAGTERLTDWSGSAQVASFTYDPPVRIGDALYVITDDSTFGEELFALPLGLSGEGAVDSFGTGCGTSAGTLEALDAPTLGSLLRLTVETAPSAPTGFLLDLDLLPLSGDACLPLLPNGLNLATVAADPTGVAELPLALPNDPALLGRNVFVGAVSIDLGEPFLGLASLSNVLGIVFGD